MARNHFKRKKAREKNVPLQVAPEPVQEKQIPRGETLKPARHGGYTHSFNYYEYTIPAKEAAK